MIAGSKVYNRLWPVLSYAKQRLSFCMPSNRDIILSIKRMLQDVELCSFGEQVLYVRNWVNTNSIHIIDDEHDRYAFHVPAAIEKLYRHYALGEGLPHLSCGPRAQVMKELLGCLSIESRLVDIFAIREGRVHPHTLIEVLDGANGRWYLHDPDFNVLYVDSLGVGVSARDALSNDIGYCSGGCEIESRKNLDNTIVRLFSLGILYKYSYSGARSVFLCASRSSLDEYIVNDMGCRQYFRTYIKERDFDPKIEYL